MRAAALLAGAIVTEVVATLSLKGALERPVLYAVAAVGYPAAFALFAALLRRGAPVGVAYGAWAAGGVATTAVVATLVFDERLSPLSVLGLGLIVLGIVAVEAGRPRGGPGRETPAGVA